MDFCARERNPKTYLFSDRIHLFLYVHDPQKEQMVPTIQTAFLTSNRVQPIVQEGWKEEKQGGRECSEILGNGIGNDRRDDQPRKHGVWRYYHSSGCNFCLRRCQLLVHWQASRRQDGVYSSVEEGDKGGTFLGDIPGAAAEYAMGPIKQKFQSANQHGAVLLPLKVHSGDVVLLDRPPNQTPSAKHSNSH